MRKPDYCLMVTDNSMIGDGIVKGCRVEVSKTEQVQNGDIAIVSINNCETAIIRRVIFGEKEITLNASNPDIKPLRFTGDQAQKVQILGRVISFTVWVGPQPAFGNRKAALY